MALRQGFAKRLAQRKFLTSGLLREEEAAAREATRMFSRHPNENCFSPRRSGRDGYTHPYASLAITKGHNTPAVTGSKGNP
jgi:hypothetical protein